MNRKLIVVNVKINGSGQVINNPQIRYSLTNGKVSGVVCVSATNINDPGIYPTTTPFISYTFNSGILTILNITGLQINSEYNLTLELIG